MAIYNINKGHSIFLLRDKNIIEAKIIDFIEGCNNEVWLVQPKGDNAYLVVSYNKDAFFTRDKARKILSDILENETKLIMLVENEKEIKREAVRKEREEIEALQLKHRDELIKNNITIELNSICESCKKPTNEFGLCGCS
ncbi:hypothetical protein [Paenibacillus sp. FSL K6-2524]|uniref:hypothetical protein n=1 Tax=Paenibacillus sp. FSL K6-2524 TaxID=2954516 RepID=UPI0030F5497B